MVGDQKSFLFIQLKIATAEDLVQLAEDVALQISTSFFHLWNIYGVDDVYHDDDGNDHDLRQHMVMLKKAYDVDDNGDNELEQDMAMLTTPAAEYPDSSSRIPCVRFWRSCPGLN